MSTNLNEEMKYFQSFAIENGKEERRHRFSQKQPGKPISSKYDNLECLENWMEDTRHHAKVIFNRLEKKEKLSVLDSMAADFCKQILGDDHE